MRAMDRASSSPRPNERTTSAGPDQWSVAVAALVDGLERDDRFQGLRQFCAGFCQFDNFLVYLFDGDLPPALLGTSVPESRLCRQMADFTAGLFLLDPFVLAARSGVAGFVRLKDIMPEGFLESEFYRYHYRYTDVLDEVRYLVPLDHRRVIHVFVERETQSSPFCREDLDGLASLEPLISSIVRARMRWLDRRHAQGDRHSVAATDLHGLIARMAPGVLTPRELEVVEMMLKGHSARSIGLLLQIEEGTVTNHKRNIYAKLDIHSMAQLFDAFLRSLQFFSTVDHS